MLQLRALFYTWNQIISFLALLNLHLRFLLGGTTISFFLSIFFFSFANAVFVSDNVKVRNFFLWETLDEDTEGPGAKLP